MVTCCNFTNASVKWEVKINTSNNINHVDKLCIHVFIFPLILEKKPQRVHYIAVMASGDELTACASMTL